MTTGIVQVACGQLDLVFGDRKCNLTAAQEAIEVAAGGGANIVVLPELTNSGYMFRDQREAASLSEQLDGYTLNGWIASAKRHNLVVVGGINERSDSGRPYSSAVIVDPSGLRAVYRKAHLWDAEKAVFASGTELPPVVDTAYGRIGVLICYDLEFPEWVRSVALRGADLLCAPVNWPLFPRPVNERPAEIIRVQANAAINRMFVAACDRVGSERGVSWVGGSVVVDPDGYPITGLLSNCGGGVVFARCELTRARDKRIAANSDVFADRQPQLYRSILEPPADNKPTAAP